MAMKTTFLKDMEFYLYETPSEAAFSQIVI